MEPAIEEMPVRKTEARLTCSGNYVEILKSFDLDYVQIGYYLQVGEIARTHGWVIHLSVVMSQVAKLLQSLVPFLLNEEVTFKIAMNETVSEDLLSGNLGIPQIGKIVKIYPDDDKAALAVAKKLVALTKYYKGPIIPTDICLGSVVYTRYESFKPIIKTNEHGHEEKYFRTDEGKLVQDCNTIPFIMSEGVVWPFKELANPTGAPPPVFFNRLYKIVDILKLDPRGNVFKGLYLKHIFNVKKCVLKQGFSNSNSDKFGRDIHDRLVWQFELYKKLSDTVPMPKMYDLIMEPSYTLLAMEYVNGVSLYQKTHDVNPYSENWQNIPMRKSLELIGYGTQLTLILEKMHKKGFVHRDVIPVNFLINRKNRLVSIDMELAYSLLDHKPDPPFTLGTPGFMSPEQEATQIPTIAQDVYSLGATLIHLFTGLTPVKFNTRNTADLTSKLEFFTGSHELVEILANCLHPDPKSRPTISTVHIGLSKFAEHTQNRQNRKSKQSTFKLGNNELIELITAGVNGLTKPPVISNNNLWYSKSISPENSLAPWNKEYTRFPGLGEGMAGPLYVLARLKNIGLDISVCKERYEKGWQFIEESYLTSVSELHPGLYDGAAGLAVSMAEGIFSGLLENSSLNREKIESCLGLNNMELKLASGISGQGVSIMRCWNLISKAHFQIRLNTIIEHLVQTQQKQGYWIRSLIDNPKQNSQISDLNTDDTGIMWFLLDYISVHPNDIVQGVLEEMLLKILQNKMFNKHFFERIATKESFDLGDGGTGIILLFIKAYETLQDNKYKQYAQNALLRYPPCIVHSNFIQQNGLAGIGELYLEAWRVFKEEPWKCRADWIAGVFWNTISRHDDGSGYWQLEERNQPTADFLTGITGILHFLARCIHPSKTGLRFLK